MHQLRKRNVKMTNAQQEKTTEKECSLSTIHATDMFLQLRPEAQDAIIDLIKSLLSEKSQEPAAHQ